MLLSRDWPSHLARSFTGIMLMCACRVKVAHRWHTQPVIGAGTARYSGLLLLSFQAGIFAATAWLLSLAAATSGYDSDRQAALWLLTAGMALAGLCVGAFSYRNGSCQVK